MNCNSFLCWNKTVIWIKSKPCWRENKTISKYFLNIILGQGWQAARGYFNSMVTQTQSAIQLTICTIIIFIHNVSDAPQSVLSILLQVLWCIIYFNFYGAKQSKILLKLNVTYRIKKYILLPTFLQHMLAASSWINQCRTVVTPARIGRV